MIGAKRRPCLKHWTLAAVGNPGRKDAVSPLPHLGNRDHRRGTVGTAGINVGEWDKKNVQKDRQEVKIKK
jgi:hypothetical protein